MKNVTVWLVNEGENLPGDDNNPRLQRMGLLAYELNKLDVNLIWWQSTFNHYQKKFRYNSDRDIPLDENFELKLLHSCGYRKNVSLKRMFHERRTAKKFYKKALNLEKPDVIVVAMPTIALTYYAVKYAKKKKVPVLADIRDLNPDVFTSPFNGLMKKIVSLAILPLKHKLQKSLMSCTGLIGTTEPYLKWGLKYAKRERSINDRVFFVSYPDNGVNNEISPDSKWKKYKSDQGIVCCFFGQFGQLVDFDTILEAAEMCAKNNVDVKFLLCGKGELLEHYRNIVAEKELKNVVLPGWVNQTDIIEVGTISDIALMAYKKNDNFDMQMPNKFSESLSLGLTILLQPTGVMLDVITQNNCGLHYENSYELYKKIEWLSKNKSELNLMKANSRKLFEKSFSVCNVYADYSNYIIGIAKEFKNEV